MAYGDLSLWDIPGLDISPEIQEMIEGYEGVDMTSQWEGTKAERDALRRRGINPQNFNPRMQGAFKDYEFTGDFNTDLQNLHSIYQNTGQTGHNNRNPTTMAGYDYRRALDTLFQQHPEQQTQSGRHYLNVGVPYFRQGDETGYQPGGQLGDFSTYHINDDTDAFGEFVNAVADSPIGTALDLAFGSPPSLPSGGGGMNLGPGGEYSDSGFGGPSPSNILDAVAGIVGSGSTFDGPPPIPGGGYESIFGPNEGDLTGAGPFPGEPVMDVPGPGGAWDLINIDIPGGVPGEDVGPFPPGSGTGGQPAAPGGSTGGSSAPEEPLPEVEEGGSVGEEIPADPTEPVPEEEDGIPPLGDWLPDIEDTPPQDSETEIPPINLPDWNVPGIPDEVGADMPSITDNEWDWLPGTEIGIDWSNILNPDFNINDLIGDVTNTATGGTSNVNIDFGDLASVLAGGFLGWDQSRQDPQYPTISDLYGGEFDEDMKGLRRDILAQDPTSWVAALPAEMRQAINEMTGFSTGRGGDVSDAQFLQGQYGMGGLGGLGSYTNRLSTLGGPEFEYDQDVFDTTMANLMPGIAGSYVDQTRDMVRNLNENLLPGIDLGASMSGNMASSRTGIEAGLARRGTEDRMADVESQLIQNAINQAQGAAMGAGGQTLGARMGTQGDILSGYGTTAQYGLPGLGESFGTAADASRLGLAGGDILRGYEQALLDAPRDVLGWQIPLINATTPAGVGNLGAPYTAPSALSGVMQGAQAGAGIWDMYRGRDPFGAGGVWSTMGNAGST